MAALDQTFIVEKVLNDRINPKTKKREFFTKWVGWSHSDNTWEPASHFDGCPEVLEEYFFTKQARKTEKTKKNVKKPSRELKKQSIINDSNASDKLVDQIPIISTNQKATKRHISGKVMRRCAVSEPESLNCSDDRIPIINGLRGNSPVAVEPESVENLRELQNGNDLESGRAIEEIIGATNESGEIEFLIKWRGHDVEDLVPARQVHSMAPQMVIQFYERHTRWED